MGDSPTYAKSGSTEPAIALWQSRQRILHATNKGRNVGSLARNFAEGLMSRRGVHAVALHHAICIRAGPAAIGLIARFYHPLQPIPHSWEDCSSDTNVKLPPKFDRSGPYSEIHR